MPLMIIAAVLVAALVAIIPGTARAAIAHLPGGATVSYRPITSPFAPQITPLDVAFTNLDYSGGPVMPSNTNYTIYWSPGGTADYPDEAPGHLGYAEGVDQYFTDLEHDSNLPQTNGGAGRQNVESVATQYNDADGNIAAYDSHFGGQIVDTHAYPVSGCAGAAICLTKAQMEDEIARVVHANNLPTDLTHMYFLITPPGVESCFDAAGSSCSAGSSVNSAYCAFHGNIGTQNPIIYSVDNWVTGNPGCDDGTHPNGTSDGVLQGGLSHEHNEAITDPFPNSAWTDFGNGSTGGENGDKCNHDAVVQSINQRTYWYQSEWSNFTGQCLARLPLTPMPVTASFGTTPTSPTTAQFTASTDAGEGAKYVWQFNDYPPPDSPQNYTEETDSPTITHEFPASGTYRVALTVMRADGMSRGVAHDVTLGPMPVPAPAEVAVTAPVAEGGGLAFARTGQAYGARAVRVSAQVTAPGPGTVTMRITTRRGSRTTTRCVAQQSFAASGPGVVTCQLGNTARQQLRRGRLAVRVNTTFVATDGATQTLSRLLTLPRRP
jgi:hypothetical protein